MKKFILVLIGLYAFQSSAATEPSTFVFKYKMPGETFEYKKQASSYKEAFEEAAQACFNHYKAQSPLSRERGMEIIDVCANPKT